MEIKTPQGTKTIRFDRLSALSGLELRDQFTKFVNSSDAKFRRAYVQRVLSHAYVVIGTNELQLRTSALIDNHLCTMENVSLVFHGILEANGIFAKECSSKSDYMTAIGTEMATSFVSACMHALEIFVGHVTAEH